MVFMMKTRNFTGSLKELRLDSVLENMPLLAGNSSHVNI